MITSISVEVNLWQKLPIAQLLAAPAPSSRRSHAASSNSVSRKIQSTTDMMFLFEVIVKGYCSPLATMRFIIWVTMILWDSDFIFTYRYMRNLGTDFSWWMRRQSYCIFYLSRISGSVSYCYLSRPMLPLKGGIDNKYVCTSPFYILSE